MNFDYTSGLFEIGYFLIFGSQSITKTIGRKTYTEDGNRHKQKKRDCHYLRISTKILWGHKL